MNLKKFILVKGGLENDLVRIGMGQKEPLRSGNMIYYGYLIWIRGARKSRQDFKNGSERVTKTRRDDL